MNNLWWRRMVGRRGALSAGAVALASALTFASGCSSDVPVESSGVERQAAGATTFTVSVPAGAALSDLVLSAQGGSLLVRDGVKVVADGERFAAIANVSTSSGAATDLGASSQTGDVVSKSSVRVRSAGVVHGSVRSGGGVTVDAGARIEGSTETNASLGTPSQVTFSVTFPSTDQGSITVANDAQRELTAGAYRDVIVRARGKLTLGPGTYTFSSLLVEPTAELRLKNDEAVIVYVKTSLVHRGVISETASDRSNVLFAVAGTSSTLVEAPFRGTLIAPQSSIVLGSTSTGHQGAFFGRSVEAQPWTTIRHRPFSRFDCLGSTSCPVSACDATNRCTQAYALPEAVTPFRAALVGTQRLSVGSGAILRDSPQAPAPLLVSGGTTRIGEAAQVGSIRSVGPVTLAPRARATGYVATAAEVTGESTADVLGELREGYALPLETTQWSVQFQTSTTDVTVSQGQTKNLAAGAYRKVVVRGGGKLNFATGRYDIDQLELEPSAVVTTADTSQTRLVLRSRLRYDAPILPQGTPKPARLLLEYFGRERVELRAPFFGALLSAAGPVAIALPQGTSQSSGTIAAPILELAAGGKTSFLQSSVDLGVSLKDQPAILDSAWDRPVEVFVDNPHFVGGFSPVVTGAHGEATGDYSEQWSWSHPAPFDLGAFTYFAPPTQFMSQAGSVYPVPPGGAAPAPLLWQRRGGTIWPGATFSATSGFDGTQPEGMPRPLWLKLSEEVLTVPVLVIGWYNAAGVVTKERAEPWVYSVLAGVDFAPGSDPAALTGEFASPTHLDFVPVIPPDDIWAQCGIQFQVVLGLLLQRSSGASQFCEPGSQSFADDHGHLLDRIRDIVGDDAYNQLFPDVNPLIVQVGELDCSDFYAQWVPNTTEIELVLPWDGNQATNLAHELGHALLSTTNHTGNSGEGNLMARGSANTDVKLEAPQCDTARANAKGHAKAYREYLRTLGRTPLPTPDTLPPEPPEVRYPRVMTASRLRALDPPRCCVVDGAVSDTTAVLCHYRGGSLGGNECTVCCAEIDPAAHDPGANTFSIRKINRDACEPSRRLDLASCDDACCDYGSDFDVKVGISRYECLASNPEAGIYPGVVVPTGTPEWEAKCDVGPN